MVVSKIFRTGAAIYTAPVHGSTTMSNESFCQVARSWVDVGSLLKRLFGVVYMTCGDFHDGSEKGTVSVHQILCQSWETYYGDPHNNSTILRGPNLESYVVVSMAYPVEDRSHISWRWQTHRETHKLHNSSYCCTDSRVRPSGSTSDHSWLCCRGGNLLWDMPTGSDERIGHEPCRRFTMTTPCLTLPSSPSSFWRNE
jgi:hypothetical protein